MLNCVRWINEGQVTRTSAIDDLLEQALGALVRTPNPGATKEVRPPKPGKSAATQKGGRRA